MISKSFMRWNQVAVRGGLPLKIATMMFAFCIITVPTQGKDILFTIDDRQSVVDMWRANGITCLQCKKGIISFYFSVKYTISIIKTSMRV